MLEPGGGVMALFMPDDDNALIAEHGQSAENGLIVAERAVARQRHKIVEHSVDQRIEMRAVLMARNLGLLPWGQSGVDIAQLLRGFTFKLAYFTRNIEILIFGGLFKVVDLVLQRGERLFKVEIGHHRKPGG